MRLQKQAYLHDPSNGIFGDCYRTCLACILDMDRDDVPHYVTTMDPVEWAENVQPKYDAWLAELGLQELAIPVHDADLEQILNFHKTRSVQATVAMLTGKSSSGCNHVVIVTNGQIVHDPSITESSIIGPCDDGFYWLTWLIPLARGEG
jgi:hypothetical protein